MTSKEPTAMRAFFLVGVTARAVTRLGSGRALRRGCSSIGKTPLDVASLAGMHAGNAEGIEGGGAIIEKQNVRAGVFAVAGIDTFILAIVNPEPIENNRHAGIASYGAELIAGG